MSKVLIGDTKKTYWGKIGDFPKEETEVNKIYEDIGLKQVYAEVEVDSWESSLFDENLTLMCLTEISNKRIAPAQKEKLNAFLSEEYGKLKGFKEGFNENYAYAFEGETDIKIRGQVVGKYFKERNILLMFFNPFCWDFKKSKKGEYLKVHNDIAEAIKVLNIQQVDVLEIGSKIVLEKFKARISTRIEEIDKEIERRNKEITEYGEKLIFSYREVTIQETNIESCKVMMTKMHQTLLDEIEAIKGLKFVKKVELVDEGIDVDVGKIILKGTHDGTEYVTYAGHYVLHITPGAINITNKDQIQEDEDGSSMRSYGHPHISNNRPCWGEGAPQIHKLIAEFKLKDLVFQCVSYLKMYNEKSPHCRLDRYAKARKYENKFDQVGQLLR